MAQEVTTYTTGMLEARFSSAGLDALVVYPLPNVRQDLLNNTFEILHTDQLGSVRAITNASGQPVNTRTYAPFGELITHSGTGSTGLPTEDKGFIGERFDADAGLQYLNARYYDTRLGLFVQPDWFEVTQAGVGTNRYSYSFNDPVDKLDPSGNATDYGYGTAGSFYTGAKNSRNHSLMTWKEQAERQFDAAATILRNETYVDTEGDIFGLNTSPREATRRAREQVASIGSGMVMPGDDVFALIPVGGWAAKGALQFGLKRSYRATNTTQLTVADFPQVRTTVSQKQNRHIEGRPEYRGGGILSSQADAQRVLDAYHSGDAVILGRTSQGFPVVRLDGVTGMNSNSRVGITNQPTNVFIVKGTASPSIVPANPNWAP